MTKTKLFTNSRYPTSTVTTATHTIKESTNSLAKHIPTVSVYPTYHEWNLDINGTTVFSFEVNDLEEYIPFGEPPFKKNTLVREVIELWCEETVYSFADRDSSELHGLEKEAADLIGTHAKSVIKAMTNALFDYFTSP